MTIEQAREWLQHHADNTPMPGAREAYLTILEVLERARWVPVAGENPPEGELILCSDGNVVFQGMLAAGVWVLDNVVRGLQPTHWMLLPEPPGVEMGKAQEAAGRNGG